jgi:hypothetical protein
MRTSEAVMLAPGVAGTFIALTALYALLGVTVLGLLRRLAATNSPRILPLPHSCPKSDARRNRHLD